MNSIATREHRKIFSSVNKIVHGGKSRNDKLQIICQLLADKIDVFDWVGFYLVNPHADRELILGPYAGEATDHTHIPFGRGICGQVAETNDTLVVQDVNKTDNYLSCSRHVKAEIVVPVMKNNEFVAELDIDSHTKDSITDELRVMLEKLCAVVAVLF